MWFSFMYGLQSDYYLVLLCSTSFYYSTHSFLSLLYLVGLDIYLYLVFPSTRSRATSDVLSDFTPCRPARAHPTFIGIRHRLDMHTVTSD